MNDLKDIVSTFSIEEQHQFIAYLEKKNKRKDAKNCILFKLLVKNELHSKELCFKLYGSNKKDAYHALRKRLFKSVIDFIATNSLQEEKAIDMLIIKYIVASRTCMVNNQYKTAYKILGKAEILAKENFLFPLLNEIYHTKIQYAYTSPELDIDNIITKFKANQKDHYLEDQLNIVYAKMRQILNSITYQGEVLDFQTILNNTLQEYNISMSDTMSFKSLYQLVTIASISAFVTKDYLKIEPFLINTYHSILEYKYREKQPFYHIQILYAIANTLFRNKKFKASQEYLEVMHGLMLSQKKKHFNAFNLKYRLLIALNLNYGNKQDLAIDTLVPLITKKHIDTEALLDVHLSLVMFYFQKGDLKNAKQILSRFYHTDKWYIGKAGKEWVIKKNLTEILLHIELNNIDLVESRLRSFKRTYFPYLRSINQQRVITYLGFVEQYYKNPELVSSTKFKETVENAFDWMETHREDIFVISFFSWLKSKMNKDDLYKTTIDLIKQAQKELTNA